MASSGRFVCLFLTVMKFPKLSKLENSKNAPHMTTCLGFSTALYVYIVFEGIFCLFFQFLLHYTTVSSD